MYIQATRHVTKRGEVRKYFRLREVRHVDGNSQSRTLLNLGRDFPLPREAWSKVTTLIKESFDGQSSVELESHATPESKVARQLIQRLIAAGYRAESSDDPYQVKVVQRIEYPPNATRSVGAERIVLQAMDMLGLDAVLKEIGKRPPALRMIKACIAARMLKPRGRIITEWLRHDSAMLELLGLDSSPLTEAGLRHVAYTLWLIRYRILERTQRAFPETEGKPFRDFTYTETFTDKPLTGAKLVPILDGYGYVQGCTVVRNPDDFLTRTRRIKNAKCMLIAGAGQVTDRWLYRWTKAGVGWLCVNLDMLATAERSAPMKWDLARFATEFRLYERWEAAGEQTCEETEAACLKLEEALIRLHENLSKKSSYSRYPAVVRRMAALNEEFSHVTHLYDIHVSRERPERVSSIDFKRISANPATSSPFRYTLRTNLTDWDTDRLESMWRRLLDNRRMFRVLNHQADPAGAADSESAEQRKSRWASAVLAYQVVRLIEEKLRGKGIDAEWSALRKKLRPWERITSVLTATDTTIFLERQDTQIEPDLRKIAETVGIRPSQHLKRSVYRL